MTAKGRHRSAPEQGQGRYVVGKPHGDGLAEFYSSIKAGSVDIYIHLAFDFRLTGNKDAQ